MQCPCCGRSDCGAVCYACGFKIWLDKGFPNPTVFEFYLTAEAAKNQAAAASSDLHISADLGGPGMFC